MEGEAEGEVLVLFPGVFVFVKAGSNLFVPVEFVAVGSGMCADPGDTERVFDILMRPMNPPIAWLSKPWLKQRWQTFCGLSI